MTKFKDYFYGQKISEYGKANGYVDYGTLASAFQHVLCNNIMRATEIDDWELENGTFYRYEDDEGNIIPDSEYWELDEDEQEKWHEIDPPSVYQCYVIDEFGSEILERETDELVWYNNELGLYVWGVTHCGTSWDYVLTDIPCERSEEKGE